MPSLETLGSQFKGRVPVWYVTPSICAPLSGCAPAHFSAHGTDELPEEYWPKMIKLGVSKVRPAPLPFDLSLN